MFVHNFKYMFKVLMRNRMLIFWTYAFPIIMGTFFNMAFSNIENSEKFDVIDIAVVNNEEFKNNVNLKNVLAALGDSKSKEQMFDIQYVTEAKAKKLLEEDKIAGYLFLQGEKQKIVVAESGINETIFKSVIEEITQTVDIVNAVTQKEIRQQMEEGSLQGMDEAAAEQIGREVLERVQGQEVSLKNISKKNLSYTMIEFYTLIAMTCLYGGIIGMTAMNQNLANMSNNGKRVAMTPSKKGTVVLSSLCAGYVIHLIGIVLLFLYTIFVIKVDYGKELPFIVLLALAGCFAGLSLGIAIGALIKAGEGAKIGIVIAVSMLGCFLSGMMGITMKYIIDKNVPLVNQLNPAGMITDGFYSLYYYGVNSRYVFDIISLLIFSGVLLLLSFGNLRRVKYDSI